MQKLVQRKDRGDRERERERERKREKNGEKWQGYIERESAHRWGWSDGEREQK